MKTRERERKEGGSEEGRMTREMRERAKKSKSPPVAKV